jgi:MFS transporter, ACS family, glucarate transporter
MTASISPASASARPTRVRYGVLGFCSLLAAITYLDRVSFGTVAPYVQREFGLTNGELGWLFTAFAFPYAIFEVPTGWMGDYFGARRTLIRIVLWWSVFTALTGSIYPSLGVLAYGALLAVRFLFGIGEAGAFPNISRALANWFPSGQRGFAQGTIWMAGRFGGGITPLLVIMLMYTTLGAGGAKTTHWRHIFWILGGIGAFWCVAFYFWFRDRPDQHPSTNKAERDLILGSAALADEGHANVPWRRILTDSNLRLLCLMYFCAAYGWYFNITWLPKYLGEFYGVTEESFGVWSFSLLNGVLLGSLACLAGGLMTDFFIRRTGNRKWGRRLFGAIGHGTCAMFYFLSLTANDPWTFVTFVALAAFCNDLTMGAAWASCIDIGGKYAGIVSGCMNTVGNLGGAVAGFATGWALDYYKTSPEMGWKVNFISYGVVYLIAVVLWMRFDATKQVAQE